MKRPLVIIFLIFFNILFSQNFIEYSKDFGLNGNVKSVEEKSYSLTFISLLDRNGKLIEQSKLSNHKSFSFNNKKMLIQEFEKKKRNNSNCEYIYNENDSLIDIKCNNQSLLARRLNKIDDAIKKEMLTRKGLLKSYKLTSIPDKNIYGSNGNILKVYYQYKAYNNTKISYCDFSYLNDTLKSITCYSNNGKIVSTREYFNDKNNNTSKEIHNIFSNNKLKIKSTYHFNKKGILENEISEEYENDEIKLTTEKKYKNFNNINTIIKNSNGNTIQEEENIFDTNQNLISYKMIRKKEDSIIYGNTELYSYNNHRNILKSTKTSFGPNTDSSTESIFKYKYDSNGNWIIKCTNKDNYPVKATSRQINYYNSENNEIINKENVILFCDPQYNKRLEKLKKEVEKN